MYYYLPQRTSHRKWRAWVKAERRRVKRTRVARLRDQRREEELSLLMENPNYRAWVEEQEAWAEHMREMEELTAQKRRDEWMARDLALHNLWLQNQKKKKKIEEEKELQEERIRREWEESVKAEEEERNKKKEAQDALLKESTRNLGEQGEATHNPEPPSGYSKVYPAVKAPVCPFFMKTGACRFGLHCSRDHQYPSSSRTILLPNMYGHLGMDGDATDDYDTDLSLEYTEADRYDHFRDFYYDVLSEFEKCGRVVQFKVCCNRSPHLKGNVYVQFEQLQAAERAVGMFNSRWYAGKQITCVFVPVEKWRSAICGLHWSHRCPKGSHCNFLHVYRNPGNEFFKADKDLIQAQPRNELKKASRTNHQRSRSLSRSHSRERRSSRARRESSSRKYSSKRSSRSTSRERQRSLKRSSRSTSRERQRSSKRSSRSKSRESQRSSKRSSRSKSRESQRSLNRSVSSRKRHKSRSLSSSRERQRSSNRSLSSRNHRKSSRRRSPGKYSDKSLHKSSEISSDKLSDKLIDKTSDKLIDKFMDKSSDKTSNKSLDKSLDKTLDKSLDKTLDKSSDKSANKSSDKTSNKSLDKSLDKTLDKSLDKSSDKSSDKSANKFMDKSSDSSTIRYKGRRSSERKSSFKRTSRGSPSRHNGAKFSQSPPPKD